jgi:hypothetical protein
MRHPSSDPAIADGARAPIVRGGGGRRGLGIAWALSLLAACGGNLSHRSVAELDGRVPVGQAIDRIRIEVQNGTVGIDSAADREVSFAGGIRRAADTAEDLQRIEALPPGLTAVPMPEQPNTLLLRGPQLPDGSTSMLGLELGIRLPPDIPLEVAIAGNGHVTIANRKAPTRVQTGRGDLRFERCAGGVVAKTGRGNVIAYEQIGDVDIHTMIGDMQGFVRQPGKKIRLVTGQGTVQCYIPGATQFDLDARAEIGRIRNGFGLEPEIVGKYGAALVSKKGDASTAIILRTASGHLSLAPRPFD